MYKKKADSMRRFLLYLIKRLNIFLMTWPFAYVWYHFYRRSIVSPFYRKGNWVVIGLFFILYMTLGKAYDAFTVSYNKVSDMVYSQMLAVIVSDFFLFIVTWLLRKHVPAVAPIFYCLAGQFVLSVIWSYLAQKWYYSAFRAKKTAVVSGRKQGWDKLIERYGLDKKFEVVISPTAEECAADLSMLEDMEAVFLNNVHSHDRNTIIKYCVDHGISAFINPGIGDVLMSGAESLHLFHLPILRLDRYDPSPEYLFIKRAFDIVSSLIALIILSPLMIVVAILIRKDGGPAFYKQVRLTKDGKEFKILKFRSMRVDAEKDGVARLSTGDKDDRITPVGHFIRKFRIDELPQLINILMGDMSVVGPRPERPEIAAKYEEKLPEFRLRLQAKCGLTGYAQVYGKYNTTPYNKLKMDLMYLSDPSIFKDLSIIFATVKILFVPESTEGVAEGSVTASDDEYDE